jgi:hypothetical protein
MTTHTQAPWTAHDDDGTGTLPCVLSDKVNKGGNFYVAQCNVFDDAKLIAAAPELLKELQNALTLLEFIHMGDTIVPAVLVNQIDSAIAAINKATA